MPTVTLLGRPGCHLCEEARDALLALRAERPFTLEERDIEDEPALLRAHLERIPVVLVDGEEVSHLVLDSARVRERLDRVV